MIQRWYLIVNKSLKSFMKLANKSLYERNVIYLAQKYFTICDVFLQAKFHRHNI